MTKALAARLRALSEKATAGPWAIDDDTDILQFTSPHRGDEIVPIAEIMTGFEGSVEAEQWANAKLIRELRNSIPAILSALENAERMKEALTNLIGALRFIADESIPDQPASSSLSDVEWAVKSYRELRKVAWDVIEGMSHTGTFLFSGPVPEDARDGDE